MENKVVFSKYNFIYASAKAPKTNQYKSNQSV